LLEGEWRLAESLPGEFRNVLPLVQIPSNAMFAIYSAKEGFFQSRQRGDFAEGSGSEAKNFTKAETAALL
jgi:hypothetical protein